MSEFDAAAAENEASLAAFISAMEGAAGRWAARPRPNAWSPAEVAEHIVMSYRETAKVARGDTKDYPSAPALLHSFMRRLVVDRSIRKGGFGMKVRTFKALTPLGGAATPAEAASRLRAVASDAVAALGALGSLPLAHPVFGAVPTARYLRFQAVHTRHHVKQLSA